MCAYRAALKRLESREQKFSAAIKFKVIEIEAGEEPLARAHYRLNTYVLLSENLRVPNLDHLRS